MGSALRALLVFFLAGTMLIPTVSARCDTNSFLATSSIFSADTNLVQRLLQIADMLEEVFSNDIPLDARLIERIRQLDEGLVERVLLRDRQLRHRVVQAYQKEHRLFFDFHATGRLIAMSATIQGKKRVVVFFNRLKVPVEQLNILGLREERDAKFLQMGFFILPEHLETVAEAQQQVRGVPARPSRMEESANQALLKRTMQEVVDDMLPAMDPARKDQTVAELVGFFRPFSPKDYLMATLPRALASTAVWASLLTPVFGMTTVLPMMAILAGGYIASFARLARHHATATLYRPFLWFLFRPVCFVVLETSKDPHARIRSSTAHEAFHLLRTMGLIVKDIPTAEAYATYLLLLTFDAQRRSETKGGDTIAQTFFLTPRHLQDWAQSVFYGYESSMKSPPIVRGVEEDYLDKSLDIALGGWFSSHRWLQRFAGMFGRERAYTYVLGDMYAGMAYAIARCASDVRAGFEFLRLLAQGYNLEKIHAELAKKFHLALSALVCSRPLHPERRLGFFESYL